MLKLMCTTTVYFLNWGLLNINEHFKDPAATLLQQLFLSSSMEWWHSFHYNFLYFRLLDTLRLILGVFFVTLGCNSAHKGTTGLFPHCDDLRRGATNERVSRFWSLGQGSNAICNGLQPQAEGSGTYIRWHRAHHWGLGG